MDILTLIPAGPGRPRKSAPGAAMYQSVSLAEAERYLLDHGIDYRVTADDYIKRGKLGFNPSTGTITHKEWGTLGYGLETFVWLIRNDERK